MAVVVAAACAPAESPPPEVVERPTPLSRDTLSPAFITDTLPGDSDDPAIWINPTAPAASLILGTDKGDSTGGVYAFDLVGRMDRARSVTPLQRMNNVDVAQNAVLGAQTLDIAAATERNRQRLRIFSLPAMQPIDDDGILLFDGDTARAPMGVALYRRPSDGATFAIVGGKSGPAEGYLWQYRLEADSTGTVRGTKVREFGRYSGTKEIEAIAVDDALGFVYYSDEQVGVRKYYADPDRGNTELALFATTEFADDHEGIAIFERDANTGYIVVSDQGAGRIHVFSREGTAENPHAHQRLAIIPVRAQETDGLEVTSRGLGEGFPEGLLVMMSNRGAFHYYDWRDVQRILDALVPVAVVP